MPLEYIAFPVPSDNPFMIAAKDKALDQPDSPQPYKVGCVIVKDHQIIGAANNYNTYHELQGCERRKLNIPSGQDYHLCPGCDPKTHSEPRAIRNARENGCDVAGSELYMYGHYSACDDCIRTVNDSGIAKVYIVENARAIFELKK